MKLAGATCAQSISGLRRDIAPAHSVGSSIMRHYTLLTCLLVLTDCHQAPSQNPLAIASPDGHVEIAAGRLSGGNLAVRIRHDGADVIAPSPVGWQLATADFGPMVITSLTPIPVTKASDRATLPYRELMVAARESGGEHRQVSLRLRAYDTGAAFRLELPRQTAFDAVRIAGETTKLRFPRDYACLAVRHSEYLNSHEGNYAPVRVSKLQGGALYDLPLSCQTGRGGETVAITESGVETYPGAYLVKAGQHGVAVRLTPLPANDRIAVSASLGAKGLIAPWRVVMIASRPERLIENRLVTELAPPSRIGNARWVRPGKAAWAWWAGLDASGVPNAGYNNATYHRYIDFAARFGLPYFVIDWGWAARPNGDDELADITRFRPDIDIPELARYAAARGVRLWLWTNWKTVNGQMDKVFALYQRWGIAGIKVDYVYRQDQIAISWYHRLLTAAARHRLMVNIHGSPVPRGLERTYPNFMTEEGVMGTEYNKWSHKVTAGYNVRLAYSRAAIGPMDYAPGAFRNVGSAEFVARKKLPEVMTTRAHQLAMFVVYPSPLQSLADAPAAYLDARGRPLPETNFLRLVPASWDETRGVAGDWGKWIGVARRSGKRWFVGVMNDGDARSVAVPLHFLGSGRWHVRAWIDGARPTAVDGYQGEVEPAMSLRIPLAAAGGAVLMLAPS